jgi:hypothetical protein
MRELLGLAWVTDDEFRMHKLCVSRLMDIKLNTLNVNLRDLHFTMTDKEKNGWSRWKREGFSRTSVDVKTEPIPRSPPRPASQFSGGFAPLPLPGIAAIQSPGLSRGTWALWMEVMNTATSFFLRTELAIEKVADLSLSNME